MYSVGFINNNDPKKGTLGSAADKIILTGEEHNAGGKEAVCFIDTDISRSSSGQPWCSDNQGTSPLTLMQPSGASFNCGTSVPCLGQHYVEADSRGSS
jgi:hypothetical protein